MCASNCVRLTWVFFAPCPLLRPEGLTGRTPLEPHCTSQRRKASGGHTWSVVQIFRSRVPQTFFLSLSLEFFLFSENIPVSAVRGILTASDGESLHRCRHEAFDGCHQLFANSFAMTGLVLNATPAGRMKHFVKLTGCTKDQDRGICHSRSVRCPNRLSDAFSTICFEMLVSPGTDRRLHCVGRHV